MKILGIDYGLKRVGLALADTLFVASPFLTLKNDKNIFNELKNICEKENIELIVVGLPKTLRGGESEQTKLTNEFANKLKKFTNLSIEMQDERFTTKIFEDYHLKKDKKKELIDQISATAILQTYLDKKRG